MGVVIAYELVLSIHTFKNLELLRKGLYRLQVRLQSGSDPATAFNTWAAPARLTSYSRDVLCDGSDQCIETGELASDFSTYNTRSMLCRYVDEEFDVSEGAIFRLEFTLPSMWHFEVGKIDFPVTLQASLLRADYTQDEITSIATKSSSFTSVAERSIQLGSVRNLQFAALVPIVFDTNYLCSFTTVVSCAAVNTRFVTPVSPPVPEPSLSDNKTDDDANREYLNALMLSAAKPASLAESLFPRWRAVQVAKRRAAIRRDPELEEDPGGRPVFTLSPDEIQSAHRIGLGSLVRTLESLVAFVSKHAEYDNDLLLESPLASSDALFPQEVTDHLAIPWLTVDETVSLADGTDEDHVDAFGIGLKTVDTQRATFKHFPAFSRFQGAPTSFYCRNASITTDPEAVARAVLTDIDTLAQLISFFWKRVHRLLMADNTSCLRMLESEYRFAARLYAQSAIAYRLQVPPIHTSSCDSATLIARPAAPVEQKCFTASLACSHHVHPLSRTPVTAVRVRLPGKPYNDDTATDIHLLDAILIRAPEHVSVTQTSFGVGHSHNSVAQTITDVHHYSDAESDDSDEDEGTSTIVGRSAMASTSTKIGPSTVTSGSRRWNGGASERLGAAHAVGDSSPQEPLLRHSGDCAALHSRSPRGRAARCHVVICFNGLGGSPHDTRLLRSHLKLLYPNLHFLATTSNQSKDTEGDLVETGHRIAVEIHTHISHKMFNDGLTVDRLSVVAFSLGGIVARLAFSHPLLLQYRKRLHAFVSIATPHLGLLFTPSPLFSMGLYLFRQWKGSRSLAQMSMADVLDDDSENVKNCLLYLLACGRSAKPLSHLSSNGSRNGDVVASSEAITKRPISASAQKQGDVLNLRGLQSSFMGLLSAAGALSLGENKSAKETSDSAAVIDSSRKQLDAYSFDSRPASALWEQFQHVMLIGSPQDSYAPLDTALGRASEAQRNDSKHGAAYQHMSTNFYGSVSSSKFTLWKTEFRSGSDSAFASASVDALLGREAHISFLENECFAKLFATSTAPLWE
jgi:hypothetical protein